MKENKSTKNSTLTSGFVKDCKVDTYNPIPPTHQDITLAKIAQIPLVDNFRIPNGFPIPLKDQVYVKQETNEYGEQKTESGIIVTTALAANVQIPHVGIVYAVGLKCSEYLVPGMRVLYNKWAEDYFMVGGTMYVRMGENDVFGIVPPDTFVHGRIKDHNELRREKRASESQFGGYEKRKQKHEDNLKDKEEEDYKNLLKSNTGRKKDYVHKKVTEKK